MLNISQTLMHYKKREIQQAIADAAAGREVAIKYGDNGFGKRPDVIKFPADVMEFAMKKATSLHVSEEIWSNPLNLNSSMTEKDKNDLRIGWDLVIDIDCHVIEYSKFAAFLTIQALQYHGVSSITCKFSGNKGFHIAVPFEAFPKTINGKESRLLFPEAPKKIAYYLKNMINEPLGNKILEFENNDFSKIIEKTKFSADEIRLTRVNEYGIVEEYLNADKIADIDTLLISSRHLYRMPFSFNEKSGLVSIPLNLNDVLSFDKEWAKAENVKVDDSIKFLDRSKAHENEAYELIIQAYDYCEREAAVKFEKEDYQKMNKDRFENKEFSSPEMAIDEKFFPPCFQCMLKGMGDGKKRALFAILNFLKSISWDKDQSDKLLHEWNSKNEQPLRETILKGQLRYSFMKKDKILPPNCKQFYEDLAICKPDKLCQKVKNPVNYSVRKSRFANFVENSKKKSEHKKKKSNKDDNNNEKSNNANQ